jgi:F-type H+-transporting ATPase subunit gamma
VPAQLLQLRRRVRSVKSTKKITKAQELVATSRIAKAQERVTASRPYAEAITNVLTALASNANIDHPLLKPREQVRRSGILLITSDRGLAGAYNANAIRAAEQLRARLEREGKQVALYAIGRKAVGFFKFRGREIVDSWTGFSERPGIDDARTVGEAVLTAFNTGSDKGGIYELYLVDTEFKSLLTQNPRARLLAPMEVQHRTSKDPLPAYEFEPEPEELLAALLPKYINARLYSALLDSAASESASRRRAMKSATDNADDLIKTLTRQMNSARQAAITQEISEIVGGANALAAAGSDV